VSLYRLYVTPSALREIKQLPGHVRQRARRAIGDLADNPRPSDSTPLDLSDQRVDCEVRRLRLEKWRVIYTITEDVKTIDVLAVRKRPPYDYGDLGQLLGGTR
jgi:mRNA-degrading endonuclease RelE of RelBE toxin-antitoxin system